MMRLFVRSFGLLSGRQRREGGRDEDFSVVARIRGILTVLALLCAVCRPAMGHVGESIVNIYILGLQIVVIDVDEGEEARYSLTGSRGGGYGCSAEEFVDARIIPCTYGDCGSSPSGGCPGGYDSCESAVVGASWAMIKASCAASQ